MRRRVVVTLVVVGAMAALALAAWVGFGGLLDLATQPVDDTVPYTAEVGECYRSGTAAPTPVSCAEPHHFEVIAVEYFPAGAERPGAWVRLGGADVCTAAFRSWTGQNWLDTDMSPTLAIPSESQWAQGERRTACALHRDDFGPMTGSARVG